MSRQQQGVIFDFDGVIVQSEAAHELCWQRVAARLEKHISRDIFLQGFGVKNELFIKELLGWTQDDDEVSQIIQEKEAYFQELIITQPLPEVAGLTACITQLKEEGIPYVIGSSSILKNIELVLQGMGLKSYFPAIVSSEDVRVGKPDPEVFLRCAELIGVPPEQCVVFEDAFYGIEAAKRAHMKAVAVTTTFSKEQFLQKQFLPDACISDFTAFDIYSLVER